MTTIIIWIRHGKVNVSGMLYDQFLPIGEEFASQLPELLNRNSIMPEVVYFDKSKDRDGATPMRCENTVKWFNDEIPKHSFECANADDAKRFLRDALPKGQVIVICYKTESFFRFQPIKGCKYEKHMGQVGKLEKPDHSVTDEMYDEMLVTSFDGSDLIWQKTIPTRCAELARSC